MPFAGAGLGFDGGLDARAVLDILRPVLEDESLGKVGHDLKFDGLVLERHGVELRGLETDTMLASYLLDATRSEHRLEDLALEHAGYKALADEDVCGRGVKALTFAQIPVEAAVDYAGERADLALQLSAPLRALLVKEDLEMLYQQLEHPLIPVLMAIERAGVRIDGPALASQSQNIDAELNRLARRVYELSGEEFNINSPKKLGEILFDKLGLKTETLRRTSKTKAHSTAFEVLEELALAHELPRLVLEWRALMKLKGTYIDALPQLVNPTTGRVHTCFNQAVAATGRLSSSDPNLQNIPIRTELGREIRRAFVAEPGHVLISADYSQIELRVLAHMSGDEALIEAFTRNEDIHDRTALKVFGPDSGLDPHELRRRAKIINYALLYGKTGLHARERHRRLAAGRAGLHRRVLRRLSLRPRFYRVHPPVGARHGRGQDDVRPKTARARHQQQERPGPRRRRTRGGEPADSGDGGRHPEAGHDQRASRASNAGRRDAPG